MLSISKCRKTLGDTVKKLSDEEVKKIRDTQDQLADIIFDQWLEEKEKRRYRKLSG